MPGSKTTLRFGIWVNIYLVGLGLSYVGALVANALSGAGPTPVEPFASVFSAITIFSALGILVLFAVLFSYAAVERKLFGLVALSFCILFTGMTTINRFVHLAVVRPSLAANRAAGLEWFLPYGSNSVMFSLEILGWSVFLGLACLFAAFIFHLDRLERGLFWSVLVIALLNLASTLSLFTGNGLFTFLGLAAWGPGLTLACILLIVLFRRRLRFQKE